MSLVEEEAALRRAEAEQARREKRQMSDAEFQQAQADHVAKVLDAAGIASGARKAVSAGLQRQILVLEMYKQQLCLLGKAEAGECLSTAIAAIEDARSEL